MKPYAIKTWYSSGRMHAQFLDRGGRAISISYDHGLRNDDRHIAAALALLQRDKVNPQPTHSFRTDQNNMLHVSLAPAVQQIFALARGRLEIIINSEMDDRYDHEAAQAIDVLSQNLAVGVDWDRQLLQLAEDLDKEFPDSDM